MLLKKNQLCEVSTMDDLQFRRGIYADPHNNDETFSPEMLSEIQKDSAKHQFSQDIQKLDKKIAQAMDVPVPEDLVNKLILRQTLASHQQKKRKNKLHLAMAASVALVVGLMVNFMQFSSAYDSLGDYALAHVYHEENLFNNNDEATISLSYLNQKMASFDGSFASSFGKLIAADFCRFDHMKSLHLVFQGKTDIVTIFVVPNNESLAFESNFNDEKLIGRSQHFSNNNIIVIADKNEPLEQWQNAISENIQWNI